MPPVTVTKPIQLSNSRNSGGKQITSKQFYKIKKTLLWILAHFRVVRKRNLSFFHFFYTKDNAHPIFAAKKSQKNKYFYKICPQKHLQYYKNSVFPRLFSESVSLTKKSDTSSKSRRPLLLGGPELFLDVHIDFWRFRPYEEMFIQYKISYRR